MPDAATRRLLASDHFARCREAAEVVVSEPDRLRALLAEVEAKVSGPDDLRARPLAVHIDISAAVVEAFLESGECFAHLDDTRAARLCLVVAGLEFLVLDDGTVPTDPGEALEDDLTVVRWVSRVAAGSEGHPIDELGGL